jgi:hypothetical protein
MWRGGTEGKEYNNLNVLNGKIKCEKCNASPVTVCGDLERSE